MDLRVADLAAAEPFYDALLPALGFTERYHGEAWKVWATTEPLPGTAYFGITESLGHLPNENRIAFWVASREDVERGCGRPGRRRSGAERPERDAVRPRLLRNLLRRSIR